MRKTEVKEVTRKKEATVQMLCDTCRADIPDQSAYFNVVVTHRLWNGDCEPGQYELCSYDCLLKHQERFYKKPKVSVGYDIEYIRFYEE